MSSEHKDLYEFKNFRLNAANPGLWRGGELVSIAPKVLETLIMLVERRGEIVSRDELLEKIWRETFVEEGNINYTISQLRKLLDDKNLIQTVPKRGYRFTGEIKIISASKISESNEKTSEIKIQTAADAEIKFSAPKTGVKRPLYFVLTAGVILILGFGVFIWRSENSIVQTREIIPPKEQSLQAYRRGKMILDDKDVENRAQKALDEFQQAVTLDPASALAHTGLVEGFMSKAVSSSSDKSSELYAKARAATEKAFALDDNLFEAYLARGWLRRNADWDWSGAESDFQRAIEMQPDSAVAHFRYSQLLSNTGRHSEALAEIERAARLDPVSEMIASGRFPLLEAAGQYERALKLAEENLADNSSNPFARRALATFQYHLGDYANVIENGEIILAKVDKKLPFAWLSLMAAAYQKINQPEKAEAMLKELKAQSENDAKALYSLAMNYAETGHAEEALDALEKCCKAREQRIIWIAVEPRFKNIKNEPRFQALLQGMNLQS